MDAVTCVGSKKRWGWEDFHRKIPLFRRAAAMMSCVFSDGKRMLLRHCHQFPTTKMFHLFYSGKKFNAPFANHNLAANVINKFQRNCPIHNQCDQIKIAKCLSKLGHTVHNPLSLSLRNLQRAGAPV